MDFQKERLRMIEEQIISRGISDRGVLMAMKKVPRHLFVPQNQRDLAYADCPLPIGEGQTISQPYMVAKMTECLKLTGEEKVLEIGTGSGYQAAILAELAKEVYTIERISSLTERARNVFKELGYNNIEIFVGDGTYGLKEFLPYNRIMVTAGACDIPSALIWQLADEGILIIPIGSRPYQVLTIIRKKGNEIARDKEDACIFVPLVGEYGWE